MITADGKGLYKFVAVNDSNAFEWKKVQRKNVERPHSIVRAAIWNDGRGHLQPSSVFAISF